ncbi:MAG: archaemetzincin family Zn-dependent metalloprotease [bacterium]|nr:archaemetzincin family Zn-dependent metalloprotease [bacterium]
MLICLLPVAGVADADLDAMERFVGVYFACETQRLPTLETPDGSHDAKRDQYDATAIMRAALPLCPPGATRLLVVTEHDIFIPMLTFIFGQAQVNGPAAVLSLARLHQGFHGLPEQRELFVERVLKEVLHELGHTFGLVHCADRQCAMSLSINVTNIDVKRGELCAACAANLEERLRALRRETAAGDGSPTGSGS